MKKPTERAEQLIQEGKLDEAKDVLMQTLHAHPREKWLYQDAVSMCLYGEMYEAAKQVFQLYRSQTGKVLDGDFSLEEVERLARNASAGNEQGTHSDVKVFKQMSFRESLNQRGHLINWCSLLLISEIHIYPDRLGVRKWGRVRAYSWSEVTSATLTRNPVQSQYVDFLEKKLCIKRGSQVIFNQDITVFKHADFLLRELKKHCQVEEIRPKKRKELPLWVWVVLVVALILVSRHFR